MAQNDEWWRGSVTYQVYPRSFQDSDGDGIGDLKGITDRLDHIASLGVDAVWLSPVFPSPMKDMGYDVSDYTDIDPCFGTLDDFDRMVARAHDLGLKVIIDQVLSHSSDEHPFFRAIARLARQPESRLVCLGRSEAGRDAAQQLAGDLRWGRLGMGTPPAAVIISTISSRNSRIGIPTIRRCRITCWTRCGSGWSGGSTGSALDTVNFLLSRQAFARQSGEPPALGRTRGQTL